MKYGNLNFLEPSGPLQACNGTAFNFFTGRFILTVMYIYDNILLNYSSSENILEPKL